MKAEKEIALKQLNDILRLWDGYRRIKEASAERSRQIHTRMRAAIERFAPAGSSYILESRRAKHEYHLAGVVQALRDDYAAGYMQTFRELLNADLFSDFLSMAEYLLQDEQLKQPSAVLAGGVLEEHLRKLCDKHSVDTDKDNRQPKNAELLNAELKKASAYDGNVQKQVTAWLAIRNSAAHAKYDGFDEGQVRNMIDGLRNFISRFPA